MFAILQMAVVNTDVTIICAIENVSRNLEMTQKIWKKQSLKIRYVIPVISLYI